MKSFIVTFIFCSCLVFLPSHDSYAQTDTLFKPWGKFSALLFGDYVYKIHSDAFNRGISQYSGIPKAFSNYQIRRLYLGYNYDISSIFTTEFLLAYEDGGVGSATLDAGGERSVYLKLANIRWKNIFPNNDIIFGAQATPAFGASSEKMWGYRAIEKTLLDKNKIASATDIGIALQGSFDDKNYGYDILYGNGSAQKLETDKFKKLSGDVWGKFMEKKIAVQIYADLNRTADNPAKDISTLKLMLAYQTKQFTVGVEGFRQNQTNALIRNRKSQDSTSGNNGSIDTLSFDPIGVSAFLTGVLLENTLSFFIRYDMFEPDNNFDGNLLGYPGGYSTTRENFFVGGLDWTPYTNIHIMPNIWYTGYSNKVGGITGPLKSDNDLASRITVYFKF